MMEWDWLYDRIVSVYKRKGNEPVTVTEIFKEAGISARALKKGLIYLKDQKKIKDGPIFQTLIPIIVPVERQTDIGSEVTKTDKNQKIL